MYSRDFVRLAIFLFSTISSGQFSKKKGWDIIKMFSIKDEQCITIAKYISGAGYMHLVVRFFFGENTFVPTSLNSFLFFKTEPSKIEVTSW